jgi:hypothetical protein
VDALYPEGYDVEIRPKVGLRHDAAQLRCKIRFAASAAVANPSIAHARGAQGYRRESLKNETQKPPNPHAVEHPKPA